MSKTEIYKYKYVILYWGEKNGRNENNNRYVSASTGWAEHKRKRTAPVEHKALWRDNGQRAITEGSGNRPGAFRKI